MCFCYCFLFGVGEYLLVGVVVPVLPLLFAGFGFATACLLELVIGDVAVCCCCCCKTVFCCCCCCCCCLSLDDAAATAAAAGEPVVMAETPPTAAATAVVDGGKRLLLFTFDTGELLFGTPVVVIVGSELAPAIAPSGFVADELLFTGKAFGLTNRPVDSFEIESLRGGSRSFTLSSVLASSKEIFFFSPSDSLPRTCLAFFYKLSF